MLGNINVINPEAVVKAFQDFTCGRVKIVEINCKHFEIEQKETQPVDGLVIPEKFPFCCGAHEQLFKIGVQALAKFPDCCDGHRRLKNANWFRKEKYSYLPDKITRTVTYTIGCVQSRIDRPNWYEDITDYIEYTVKSFGQFPTGYGAPLGLNLYLYNVEKNLETLKEIPQPKKNLLIDYVKGYTKKPKEESNKADLNILLITYQRWLKLFPFELNTYFGGLKEHFEKHLPFIDGKVQVNEYLKAAKGKLHTKESLFNALLNITSSLLTEINGVTLLEKGLINDAQKIQIELLGQERKQKLKDGYKNSSPHEDHRFRKMIKDWLQDERIYWKKIEPMIKDSSSNLEYDKISEDYPAMNRVPFEIRFIYKQLFDRSSGQRFMEMKGPNYHFFTPFILYKLFIEDFKGGKLYTDYLEPLSYDNVQTYYKSYGDGFLKGYHGFDNKVKSSTAIFSDTDPIVKRVFECINTSINGLKSYGEGWVNEKRVDTVQSQIWFDAGIKAGENYKAWYFVLNNSGYFVSLFRSYPLYIKQYKNGAEWWKIEPGGEGVYSHLAKLLQEIGEPIEENTDQPNNFLLSTIEDYLSAFTSNMSNSDYKLLVQSLNHYFEKGSFPQLTKSINVYGKFNKKKLGWALNQLFRSQRQEQLATDYLEFGKKHISAFKTLKFDKKSVVGCQLYKYYTTKTQ